MIWCMQRGAVMTRSVFSQILTIHTLYLVQEVEVCGIFASSKSDLCSLDTQLMYTTSCYTGPYNNGTDCITVILHQPILPIILKVAEPALGL